MNAGLQSGKPLPIDEPCRQSPVEQRTDNPALLVDSVAGRRDRHIIDENLRVLVRITALIAETTDGERVVPAPATVGLL